jgi:hypothetical protein
VATYGAVLEALADPTRRSVFELIAERPTAVVDIAGRLPVSRPAAGLVVDQPHGTRRLYRLDPGGVRPLRDYLDRFWSDALDRFAAAAEQRHRTEHRNEEEDR